MKSLSTHITEGFVTEELSKEDKIKQFDTYIDDVKKFLPYFVEHSKPLNKRGHIKLGYVGFDLSSSVFSKFKVNWSSEQGSSSSFNKDGDAWSQSGSRGTLQVTLWLGRTGNDACEFNGASDVAGGMNIFKSIQLKPGKQKQNQTAIKNYIEQYFAAVIK